jgi:hypothetical protein
VQDQNTVTCRTKTRSRAGPCSVTCRTDTVMCRTGTRSRAGLKHSQLQDRRQSCAGPKHGHVQDRNTVTCRTETRSRAGPKHSHLQDRNTVTCRTDTKEAYHPPLSPSLIDLFRWFSRALGPLFKRPKFSTLIHRVKTFNYCERRVYFNSNLQGNKFSSGFYIFMITLS